MIFLNNNYHFKTFEKESSISLFSHFLICYCIWNLYKILFVLSMIPKTFFCLIEIQYEIREMCLNMSYLQRHLLFRIYNGLVFLVFQSSLRVHKKISCNIRNFCSNYKNYVTDCAHDRSLYFCNNSAIFISPFLNYPLKFHRLFSINWCSFFSLNKKS